MKIMQLCRSDYVCSSSAYEAAVMNSTMMSTTKRKRVSPPSTLSLIMRYSNIVVKSVCGPLAVVTNGLSLITFARMYRAKQQVISMTRCIMVQF